MVRIPTKVLLVDDEKDFVEMLSLRLPKNLQPKAHPFYQ